MAPTLQEIQNDGLDNVNECCARLQIPDVLRDAIGARIGSPGGGVNYSIQLLVQLTQPERDDTVDNVPLLEQPPQPPLVAQPRVPTLFEKAQVRALLTLVDMVSTILNAPPFQPVLPAAPAAAQAQAPQAVQPLAGIRKVKVSEVLDPMDEMLVDPITPGELNQFYANYRDLKHGDPQQECEPTMEQISAFNARVVTLQLAPYADFSILTPFGRRMSKILKHRAWVANRDGTYRTMEVPGPDSYDVWYSCWRVYSTCCLMLRWPQAVGGSNYVLTPAALEYYQENFRQLAQEYSECWFLCCKAEDACRAEHLTRTRRRLMAANGGAQVSWSDVFIEVADDSKYWDREVRRPAMLYLARGKRGGEPTAAYEEDPTGLTTKIKSQLGVAGASQEWLAESPSKRQKKTKAEKAAAKAAAHAAGSVSVSSAQASSPPPPQAHPEAHPRKRGSMFITSREGTEVCFTFAKGARDQCSVPCPGGRAHVCQFCLGPHRNSECSRANNQGGRGGKGGKGK